MKKKYYCKCGNEISDYRHKKCRRCSDKLHSKFMEGNDYFKGHKHSKKSKELISKKHADFSGDKNPNFNGASICPICGEWKNYKANLCKKCYNNKRKIELPKCFCGKELSSKESIRCHSCETKRRHKIGIYKSKNNIIKYKGISFRSSWEVSYAKYLDKKDIKWLYENKYFEVGNKLYFPDFYLPEKDTYVEIKGFWRGKSKDKFDLFKKLYKKIKIKLLYKKDLIKLKIINSGGY